MAKITEEVPLYSVVPDPNNSVTFENDGAIWLTETNPRIISSNLQAKQMNEVKDEVEYLKGLTDNNVATTISKAKEATDSASSALASANEATIRADEIKTYVIPTEATLSEEEIKKQIRMSQILYITGA